ncbi:MAG: hypothetical protein NTY68_04905 [Candidatus Micrarchaeota archaeon]|nr:hypothetical protein [Candidatus Micrarchaeota archaeon]
MEMKIGDSIKGRDSRKGQAALDFMMTYGWAIVLVVIIAIALFAMGIFDPSNFMGSKAAGFAGVTVTGWSMDNTGAFSIRVVNNVGNPVRLDSINVTIAGTSALVPVTNATLAVGETSALLTSAAGSFGTPAANTGYSAKANIRYTDVNAGFPYTSSGTLTGKVMEK